MRECSRNVVIINASLTIESAALCLGKITGDAGQCLELSQGFLERKMLKAVQGIVMHKIENGRLTRQDMIQMV